MTGDNERDRSDLDDFGERLAKARGPEPKANKADASFGASAGDGLRIAVEFVVSVFVGAGLGYTIGYFLGAPVVGLILGMPIGFAAGLRTVYRGMTAEAAAADEERDVPDGND